MPPRLAGVVHERRDALIALTATGRPPDHARSVAAGFDQHLVKPVDLDELLRVISSHVTAS